jgi:PadR family transcriptional regulator, regulatory protein AphA
MDYQLVEVNGQSYVECLADGGVVASERDALDLVAACGESGTARLMLHAGNLPAEFYDLKTGLAGNVLLKLGNYRLQVAAVLTPELVGNGRFYEMVLETNRRSRDFRVFYTRAEAEAWLIAES